MCIDSYNEKKEYDIEMAKRFPNLYADMHGDMRTTCMTWGLCIPKGWRPLLEETSEKIEREIVKLNKKGVKNLPKATQVKDKLASLRIYMNYYHPKISKIIGKASRKSQHTCETCGARGEEINDNGWYRITCDSCFVGRYCVIAIYCGENYAETLCCYIKADSEDEACRLIEQSGEKKNIKVYIKSVHICDEFENWCADYRYNTGKEPTIARYNWYKFKKRWGIK
jgi:hypothetical protein